MLLPVLVGRRPARRRAGLEEAALVEHEVPRHLPHARAAQLLDHRSEEVAHLAVRRRVVERVPASVDHEVTAQDPVHEIGAGVEARLELAAGAELHQRRGAGHELHVRGRTQAAIGEARHELAAGGGLDDPHGDHGVRARDLAAAASLGVGDRGEHEGLDAAGELGVGGHGLRLRRAGRGLRRGLGHHERRAGDPRGVRGGGAALGTRGLLRGGHAPPLEVPQQVPARHQDRATEQR